MIHVTDNDDAFITEQLDLFLFNIQMIQKLPLAIRNDYILMMNPIIFVTIFIKKHYYNQPNNYSVKYY